MTREVKDRGSVVRDLLQNVHGFMPYRQCLAAISLHQPLWPHSTVMHGRHTDSCCSPAAACATCVLQTQLAVHWAYLEPLLASRRTTPSYQDRWDSSVVALGNALTANPPNYGNVRRALL